MYQENVAIDAVADLSGDQYKTVAIGGTVAGSAALAMGILQNKPRAGEDATVCPFGRSKFFAGGAIATGALITCAASGFMTTAASGDAVIGKNMGSAVASGAIGHRGFFNFVSFTKID